MYDGSGLTVSGDRLPGPAVQLLPHTGALALSAMCSDDEHSHAGTANVV